MGLGSGKSVNARRRVIAGAVVMGAGAALGWLVLRKGSPAGAGSAGSSRGEELARVYCQGCHVFPEPGILDKGSWTNGVLPEMGRWLGLMRPGSYGGSLSGGSAPGGQVVEDSNVFPSTPLIGREDWAEVVRYYAHAAPSGSEFRAQSSELLRRVTMGRPGIGPETRQFRVKESAYRRRVPMSSMVKVVAQSYGGSPAGGTGVGRPSNAPALFVGDALTHTLEGLDVSGNRVFAVEFDSGPISLVHSYGGSPAGSGGLLVTLVGRLFPSDLARGRVVRLRPDSYGGSPGMKMETLLRGLRRPVHMAAADLNGDGREDLVVSEFGNRKGKLSWWELLPEGHLEGRYREHVLLDRAGAIRTEVRDMTGDGRPDIVALMGQGWEGLYLFVNSSGGSPGSPVGFTQSTLLQQHPAWGYSYFELVDFDRDGDLDLLTTNGDNGDAYAGSPAPHKPYHGIRLYLNSYGGSPAGGSHAAGAGSRPDAGGAASLPEFTERWFFPLHGAYGARAVDFDLDGDLDVAAISYFPDFATSPGFVYLENTGSLEFRASTIPQHAEGRWMTMDAGDLDGDGDVDIVIGSLVLGPTSVPIPSAIQERWTNNAPAILVLENVAK